MEMQKKIAQALLIRTYCEISAVVSLDEQGMIMNTILCHTHCGGPWMQPDPEAAQIWLMTNHPEGRMALYEADTENAARLKERFPFIPLRVFVTGEDIGCREAML